MNQSVTFDAIGTRWRIDADASAKTFAELKEAVVALIDTFDASFSRFRSDSWVSRVRHQPGTHQLPPDGYALLRLYRKLYEASGGLVTPLIGEVMEQAGYDPAYSLVPTPLSAVPAFDAAIAFDATSLTTHQPVLLDFGAAGKGYLIDRVGELLTTHGVDQYLINAGGDLLHHGALPVEVGLENPFNHAEAIGVFTLQNASLCGSSGSRRQWAGYTHIMNPSTGRSPRETAATWAHASGAALADGLATALSFCAPKRLHDHFDFEWAILAPDMTLTHSPGFNATFFEETDQ